MNRYRTYGQQDDAQGEDADEKFFGVNNRLEPDKLPAGLCADAQNVRMRDGTPTTRLGTTRPGWLNVTRAAVDAVVKGVGTFYGAGTFKDPNGFEWVLTAADGGIFRHKPHNGRTAITLPVNVLVLSACSFCQAFNVVYCFRGKYLQPLIMQDVDTGFEDLVTRWNASTVYDALVLATGQAADEVAYGPFQSISSLTSVGDLATCVTAAEHGYITGADVVISGAVDTGYNARWNITVVDVNTFTFQFSGATGIPATGTPKVSNMSLYWRALGSRVSVTTGDYDNGLQLVTYHATAHGFTNGQYVTITGAIPAEFNVTAVISGVAANTFKMAVASELGTGTGVITGTILAQTSIVLAGQSPDTNPEAWVQIFNVLPNSDDGIFVNNRLLAATSYTPGNTEYDSTSTYTKKDFLVALDIQDLVHFDFVNEFRINQGGDDEIVQLLKAPSGAINAQGQSTDAVIVLKGKSWAVLTGVSGDLSQVALDTHMDGYGACALRGGVVAGRNVLFGSSSRGISGLVQFLEGQARSVDVPFSNDVPGWIDRIAWQYGAKIRIAYWNDLLYVAAPLDEAQAASGSALFQNAANASGGKVEEVVVTVGATYEYLTGNSTGLYTATAIVGGGGVPAGTTIGPGLFVATQPTYYIFYPSQVSLTATVTEILRGVNNAVMVFDFRVPRVATEADASSPYVYESGQWVSLDSGESLCVKEWFKGTYNGRERLYFIGEDGWVNLVEESDAGDEVESSASLDGLSHDEIVLDWTSRGYRLGSNAQKKWKWLELVLGVWNALFDVYKGNQAAGTKTDDGNSVPTIDGKSFSRTKYLKPVGKADYVAGNINGDSATPGRGDYSMPLTPDLSVPAAGVQGIMFQEVVMRQSVRTLAGRYAQFRVRNRRGRMKIKAVTPSAGEGQRRAGILI